MREERATVYGDLTLQEDLLLYAMVTGNAVVPRGLHLDLHGMIGGDLRVDAGGTAAISGTVSGSVVNSGEIEVWGVVHGKITDAGGTSVVHAGSVVRGRRVGPTT
jgi:cytoskeletal protein CcmA (bactofilin family)